MISLPPSCTLCLQAKPSIWGKGRRAEEEEINTSTVISSQSATWKRSDFTWLLLRQVLGEARRGSPSSWRGGQVGTLHFLHTQSKKQGWTQSQPFSQPQFVLVSNPQGSWCFGIIGNTSSWASQQRPWGFKLPWAFLLSHTQRVGESPNWWVLGAPEV